MSPCVGLRIRRGPAGPGRKFDYQDVVPRGRSSQKAGEDRKAQAVKNDEAKAPEELWNGFLMEGLWTWSRPETAEHVGMCCDGSSRTLGCAVTVLPEAVQANVYRSNMQWIKGVEAKGMVVSLKSLAALHRVTQSFTPFSWRWPELFQDRILERVASLGYLVG
jgi:hypothetical protein